MLQNLEKDREKIVLFYSILLHEILPLENVRVHQIYSSILSADIHSTIQSKEFSLCMREKSFKFE